MASPSLQDGIDTAGSPIKLLWKPNAPGFTVPVLPPEFVGWPEEQASWRNSAAFMNQSFHMRQIFLEGPDVRRLLGAISVNDYDDFEIGRAKQFVPVTPAGHLVTDGIVMRHGMAGMPGYEFIGDYKDAEAVKEALLTAGKASGIVPVGGLAYFTGGVESGWVH